MAEKFVGAGTAKLHIIAITRRLMGGHRHAGRRDVEGAQAGGCGRLAMPGREGARLRLRSDNSPAGVVVGAETRVRRLWAETKGGRDGPRAKGRGQRAKGSGRRVEDRGRTRRGGRARPG
ncbi:hypothetical protein GCM10010172_67880 [Paractinoplanes ferrugineus]|uniref:Uncharacterized protein n=1 Tax=Paractinoplanes ferrugineus TaxID=113564 RepID=A0A919JBE9_9ACTN|nr:hypothetical protein Afe05nite_83980 [Actinoplanes ferrugineus]